MRKIELVSTKPMLLDYKKPSEPDMQKLLSKLGNTSTRTVLDINRNNYFYCAECETKVKVIPYFKTWCPCKDSSVISTMYETEYNGCAVPESTWKQMEIPDSKIIFYPVTSDIYNRY